MNRPSRCAGCLLALLSTAAAVAQAPASSRPLDFSPLQGCWQSNGVDATIEEQWMAPHRGIMLGMSRTIRDGHVAGYEFLRLLGSGDHAELTAWPSGQEETTFQLTRYTEGEWVFENPTHDFPKRVVYRVSENAIHASIHATAEAEDPEGEGRRVDFYYERVACPGE